jgi:hypothetical protein
LAILVEPGLLQRDGMEAKDPPFILSIGRQALVFAPSPYATPVKPMPAAKSQTAPEDTHARIDLTGGTPRLQ